MPLARKGYRIYQKNFKPVLEPEHLGEYVAIEVDSGDCFLGHDLDNALELAERKCPKKEFFVLKVGELAVASFKHHYSYRFAYAVS